MCPARRPLREARICPAWPDPLEMGPYHFSAEHPAVLRPAWRPPVCSLRPLEASAPVCPRAAAKISATLMSAAGFPDAGAAAGREGAGVVGVVAGAASSLWDCDAGADASASAISSAGGSTCLPADFAGFVAPPESPPRHAAKMSSTDIFFFSAIVSPPTSRESCKRPASLPIGLLPREAYIRRIRQCRATGSRPALLLKHFLVTIFTNFHQVVATRGLLSSRDHCSLCYRLCFRIQRWIRPGVSVRRKVESTWSSHLRRNDS
jgi:hypothetical protein